MKKTITITTLAATALLSTTPFLVSADEDYRENEYREYRRESKPASNDLKQYSAEEMRIMAHGRALKRFGPGVTVTVDSTEDGTYKVQFRDSEENLVREQEFNRYGAPVRIRRSD